MKPEHQIQRNLTFYERKHDASLRVETLALLTAQLMQRHDGNLEMAISEAVQVWLASCRKMDELRKPYNLTERLPVESIPQKFPICFEDLLRYLMPSVDKSSDRVIRFKAWLKSDYGGKCGMVQAGEELAKFKKKKISEGEFQAIVLSFKAWQQSDISQKRSKAAKSRKPQTA